MSASLFSSTWYLVADLKIRLRGHTEIHRHKYRGQIWYILQDKVTGKFHRFSVETYQIIGMFDGVRTVDEVWNIACQRLGDDMPSQDEIIALLSKLFNANILLSDKLPDIDELDTRHRSTERKRFTQQLKSPLGIRIPLFDPEKFLCRTMPLIKPIFSLFGLALWLSLVVYALILAGINWQALTSNMSDRVLPLENVLLMILVYPIVKTLHEFGHAYTVKRWGGEVHEMGIMLLVFFPVPYVDASAASAFQTKYQRMLVGAAGILVEVLIASIAMIVWTLLEPGTARSVAFNIMMLASISTLLFNGNPLLRFDAYYVLADYLEIPNLGGRANQYFIYIIKRYVLRIPNQINISSSRRESAWLFFYAIAAFIYRMFVMLIIAMFIAVEYLFIGMLLAIWSLYISLISPLIKMLWAPFSNEQLQPHRRQVLTIGFAIAALITTLLAWIPLPYATMAEGVLVASENSQVRADVSGFVKTILVNSGEQVVVGDVLVELDEPELVTEVEILQALVNEAKAIHQSQLNDRSMTEINREVLKFRQQEYERVLQRQESLKIRSPRSGQFIIHNAEQLPGRYLHRGELLANVVNFDDLPATVLIREESIDAVRHRTERIEVRLISDRTTSYVATVRRIVPTSSKNLPSEVLSIKAGGRITLDPRSKGELQAFSRHYQILIDIHGAPKKRLNERVYVLFMHEPEALIFRWLRSIRRAFLRHLDV